jgi:outer membrane protein assembly factor BamB
MTLGSPVWGRRAMLRGMACLPVILATRPAAGASLRAPALTALSVPGFPDANAIWGATGRDVHGRLWFGVSAKRPGGSAHLLRLDPATGRWTDAGAVNDRLAQAGVRRDGEGQVKIHSRILQAPDGRLYFTSMDEDGELEDGSRLPRWGSHLWRIDPATLAWERLLAVPEGLVAAAAGGPFVFALGYFGHVLYRFDTRSGEVRRAIVGAEGGHACRNVLADARGHAFVPRLGRAATGAGEAHLVEFDARFDVRAATLLPRYPTAAGPAANHGIVGLASMPDGRSFFTTHDGWLHELVPQGDAATAVVDRGLFHPDGVAYAPSLFVMEDGRALAGVTQRDGRFDWVRRELPAGRSAAVPLDLGMRKDVLLYGSMTTDDAGRCYIAGWQAADDGGHRPLLLSVADGG